MIIGLASAAIMLALLDRALRFERISTAQMRAKFELFAIRDDLRRLERTGVLSADRWFSYMDTTLTRSTASIEVITLWHAIGYIIAGDRRHQNVIAQIDYAERVRQDAMKDAPELVEIHARYSRCIRELFKQRHALLWNILGAIGTGVHAVSMFRDKVLKAASGSPENSTLLDYAYHV